jgi:hypothetical protein
MSSSGPFFSARKNALIKGFAGTKRLSKIAARNTENLLK